MERFYQAVKPPRLCLGMYWVGLASSHRKTYTNLASTPPSGSRTEGVGVIPTALALSVWGTR